MIIGMYFKVGCAPFASQLQRFYRKHARPLRMVFALTGKLFAEFLLCRLDLAVSIDRSGNQCVATRRDVTPRVRPKEPGKAIARVIDSSASPSAIVNPDFDSIDTRRASPSRASYLVLESISGPPARHPGDDRFQVRPRDRRIQPNIALRCGESPQALITPRHLTPFVTSVQNFDPAEPLYMRHTVPAWQDETQGKPVCGRKWLAVHF